MHIRPSIVHPLVLGAGVALCALLPACSEGTESTDTSTSSSGVSASSTSSGGGGGSTSSGGASSGVAQVAGLVISEISATGEDWVELFNSSTRTMDLTGIALADADGTMPKLTDAVRFAGITLGAGERLLVLADQPMPGPGLQTRCLASGGPPTCVHAAFGISATNGDTLYVLGAQDQVILRADLPPGAVTAGTTWCRLPDGIGEFAGCAPTPGAVNQAPGASSSSAGSSSSSPGSSTSTASASSAGSSSSAAASSAAASSASASASSTGGSSVGGGALVVINEVTSSGDDTVELFNVGDAAADLSGWSLSDSDPTNTPYTFDAGTTLASGARMVMVKNTHHTFGLGSDDLVVLKNGQGAVVDQVDWPADAALVSYCRLPDGAGTFSACRATFGEPNAEP